MAANIFIFKRRSGRYFTTGLFLSIFGGNIKKLLSINPEDIRTFCLGKKAVEEGFPFGNDTLVFKVGGKVFLLLSLNSSPLQFNVKCEPTKAIELRGRYSNVIPGYHMNKTHWNTVICDNTTPKKLFFEWIDDSYALVVQSLTKKSRSELGL